MNLAQPVFDTFYVQIYAITFLYNSVERFDTQFGFQLRIVIPPVILNEQSRKKWISELVKQLWVKGQKWQMTQLSKGRQKPWNLKRWKQCNSNESVPSFIISGIKKKNLASRIHWLTVWLPKDILRCLAPPRLRLSQQNIKQLL